MWQSNLRRYWMARTSSPGKAMELFLVPQRAGDMLQIYPMDSHLPDVTEVGNPNLFAEVVEADGGE